LAEHLGISEDYLRPADHSVVADVRGVAPAMPEGERIDVDDLRDQRLRESVRRELKASKAGEIWLVQTPLIEAKYPAGTYVVVDTAAMPYERDYVLAEVFSGREKSHIFRMYLPPNLIASVVHAPGVRGVTVDGERVVIRGVIRVGFR